MVSRQQNISLDDLPLTRQFNRNQQQQKRNRPRQVQNQKNFRIFDIIRPQQFEPFCKATIYCVGFFGLLFIYVLFKHPWIPNFHGTFVTAEYPYMVHECRPFYITGFNLYNAIEIALLNPSHFHTHKNKIGKQLLHDMFDAASSLGLNMVRVWAHSINPNFPFQKQPGVYANDALDALDYTISLAKMHGMKIMISFIDNWKYYNGVDQYIDWSQTAPVRKMERFKDPSGDFHRTIIASQKQRNYENRRHSIFFNNEDAKNIYKAHVQKIVTRINRYTGYKYSEDPTIMAWNLINEARCNIMGKNRCDQRLNLWYIEMAQLVKSLDSNHLVASGSEGFWGKGQNHRLHNPDSWGEKLGQDFIKNGKIQNIDYLSVHVWPNNWNRSAPEFLRDWIIKHIVDAEEQLKKPVIIEEFGRRLFPPAQNVEGIREQRDPIYKNIYQTIENAIQQERPIVGSLFWRLFWPTYADEMPDEYAVKVSDSTAAIIRSHARKLSLSMNSIPPRPECGLECWVPTSDRTCIHVEWACEEYYESPANHSQHLYFTSQAECCWPVRGAFMEGCKNTPGLV